MTSSDGANVAAGVSTSGYLYTSNDTGYTWTQRTGAGSHPWVGGDSSIDGTVLYFTSPTDTILAVSPNSGSTWTTYAKNYSYVACSSDGSKAVACTTGSSTGAIYTSIDTGANWTQQSAPTADYRAVASSEDGIILYAAAYGGYIYLSVNSGSTWTAQTSWGAKNWHALKCSRDGTRVIGAVDNGYLYVYILQTGERFYGYTEISPITLGYLESSEVVYIDENKWLMTKRSMV